MGEEEKIHLSWEDVEGLVQELAEKLRASGFEPECLIGITVGGIIPLALLADKLGTKDVATVSARSYTAGEQGKLQVTALPEIDLRGKRVLLVDEIADRGTTLAYISELFREKYGVGELKAAVLVVNKKNCEHWPDYHAREVDRWVVFPWDR